MNDTKLLTLDTNILLRAVLGIRVPSLLRTYRNNVFLNTPRLCFEEARTNLPEITARRNFQLARAITALDDLERDINVVEPHMYGSQEREARARIASRDVNDWPIVATALALDSNIWTEDQDFFGCGIATWTTATVEIYLRNT